jgi:hypothetical protein
MYSFLDKLASLDRRLIFLALAALLALPVARPLGLPNAAVARDSLAVYEAVEALPKGAFLLVSLDYDPATAPELHPQAAALLRHAFRRRLRVVLMTLSPAATGLLDELAGRIPGELGPGTVYGRDFAVLPFQPNLEAVLTQLGLDLYAIYDADRDGRPLRGLPVMEGVSSARDAALCVSFSGAGQLDKWITYLADRYRVPLAGGTTGVSQLGLSPYLQTGQLKGLLGGMKGGADYETLLGVKGKGTSGLDALNLAHLLVVALVAGANLPALLRRRRK